MTRETVTFSNILVDFVKVWSDVFLLRSEESSYDKCSGLLKLIDTYRCIIYN